jgi:membrane fusion protein (multidrug efflux system)
MVDGAQVDGHIDLVSARISGTVTYINPRVENNQVVEAGTLLVELDPREYEAELAHAKADLNTRIVEAEEANLLAAQHKLQQDDAIRARAERDRVRYLALVEKHEISRSDYDARDAGQLPRLRPSKPIALSSPRASGKSPRPATSSCSAKPKSKLFASLRSR